MKKVIIILILVVFASCNETFDMCKNHNETEIEFIEEIFNSQAERNLLSLSKVNGMIQYHGTDSWGWFDHTIRIIEKDGNGIIQLIDNRNDPITKINKSTYSEIELTKNQIETLDTKIDSLLCKSINLEPGIGIDGSFYELIIKRNNMLQAFRWQTIFRSEDLEQKKLKDQVTIFVGDLMSLCQFPNGSKQIVQGRNYNTKDSIEIEVFPANQYNQRKSEVYFDNKLVDQNKDGIAELIIHIKDTIGIHNRVKIKIELLNGKTIEM